MRVVSFIDLDGTFIQSLKDAPKEVYFPAYLDEQGRVIGCISAKQREVAEMLFQLGKVVPVTGRTSGSLARVLLPFQNTDTWKVVCHGALVLRGDELDQEWLGQFDKQIMRLQRELPNIFENLLEYFDTFQITPGGASYQIKKDHDFFTHISIKTDSEKGAERFFFDFVWWRKQNSKFLPYDYATHRNGREITVRLADLDKKKAVRWIIERESKQAGELMTFGFGDSLSDVPFLDLCDFACFPGGSEIATELFYVWDVEYNKGNER